MNKYNNLEDIKNRILEKKKELKISYNELEKKTGLHKSTLQRCFTGNIGKLGVETLEKLAIALNTTPSYLMGWDNTSTNNKTDNILSSISKKIDILYDNLDEIKKELNSQNSKYIQDSKANYISKKFFTVKCFGTVSAGLGTILGDRYMEEITIDFKPPKHDYVLKIDGDSMEPAFHNEQLIFVKEQNTINNGQFGIFILDGQGYFKKYEIDYFKKAAKLISLNPEYDDIDLSNYDDVRCVGLVIV